MLGAFYVLGLGVPKNYKKAEKMWREMAAQGDAEAQLFLGMLYASGTDVPQSYRTAAKWWSKSAAQGNDGAQVRLGFLYMMGYGVTLDYKTALQWFLKAAEKKNDMAEFLLSVSYVYGHGVPRDTQKALTWLQKSVADGNKIAKIVYDICEKVGTARAFLPPMRLGQSFLRLAGSHAINNNNINNFVKSASEGDGEDALLLGNYYYRESMLSSGNPQSPRAFQWWIEAAKQNVAEAQLHIGYYYMMNKDYAVAVQWFQAAAAQGNSDAENDLGTMYVYGLGMPSDFSKAISWYGKAVQSYNVLALENVGIMYEYGIGVKQSNSKAIEWDLYAVSVGDISIYTTIAKLYFEDGNYSNTYYWLWRAAYAGMVTQQDNGLEGAELSAAAAHLTPAELQNLKKQAEAGYEQVEAAYRQELKAVQ